MFDKNFEERFWSKAERKDKDSCWNWKAYKNRDGYGNFSIDGSRRWNAHRISYAITNGEIPKGMSVCHKCDNPSCVNPNHLFLATHKENMRDKSEKGRAKTRKLTQEQKEFIKNSPLKPKVIATILDISGRAVAEYKKPA